MLKLQGTQHIKLQKKFKVVCFLVNCSQTQQVFIMWLWLASAANTATYNLSFSLKCHRYVRFNQFTWRTSQRPAPCWRRFWRRTVCDWSRQPDVCLPEAVRRRLCHMKHAWRKRTRSVSIIQGDELERLHYLTKGQLEWPESPTDPNLSLHLTLHSGWQGPSDQTHKQTGTMWTHTHTHTLTDAGMCKHTPGARRNTSWDKFPTEHPTWCSRGQTEAGGCCFFTIQ